MKKIALLVCLFCCHVAGAQDTFRLVVPSDPSLKSTAVSSGNRMTISTGGSSFNYMRKPAFDSKDGKYAAYYSLAAKQYLRFPTSGSGKMFIGTLQGLTMTWRESKMIVEKAARPATGKGPLLGGPNAVATSGPAHLAQYELADGTRVVGYVDGAGKLNIFQGRNDKWQPRQVTLQQPLAPNAQLHFYNRKENRFPTSLWSTPKGDFHESFKELQWPLFQRPLIQYSTSGPELQSPTISEVVLLRIMKDESGNMTLHPIHLSTLKIARDWSCRDPISKSSTTSCSLSIDLETWRDTTKQQRPGQSHFWLTKVFSRAGLSRVGSKVVWCHRKKHSFRSIARDSRILRSGKRNRGSVKRSMV